ncbi:MAG: UDP-N-acetylglucosamine 2-epimerase (non-hydrolyzing) [Nitrospiraceae bacterium]|nr:UDP-N-acetylglucosamine 2-epimerase (non-hydrolyzing) [Nitrospiraceae bacterium]
MKILTVVGARPQFVKAAVISREIAAHNAGRARPKIEETIVHTGQHYDDNMSGIFFKEMHIPDPDYNLGVSDCSHGEMTGIMLGKIEGAMLNEKPDVALLYGDTNSTLAGALAAAKLHIPVAHVEAGLRCFNMDVPEEINRILTDHVSSLLFCPSETAIGNLLREGIGNNPKIKPRAPLVLNAGDVMYDAALFYRRMAKPGGRIRAIIDEMDGNFYLATIHRPENTDDHDRLRNIADAFELITRTTPIVLPLHPRTKKALSRHGLQFRGVTLTGPMGYFDMLALLDACKAVITDSGGLQKEAYFFRKQCITLRRETEWVELVEHGFNILAGAEKEAVIEAEKGLSLRGHDDWVPLYGRGDAGAAIVRALAGCR